MTGKRIAILQPYESGDRAVILEKRIAEAMETASEVCVLPAWETEGIAPERLVKELEVDEVWLLRGAEDLEDRLPVAVVRYPEEPSEAESEETSPDVTTDPSADTVDIRTGRINDFMFLAGRYLENARQITSLEQSIDRSEKFGCRLFPGWEFRIIAWDDLDKLHESGDETSLVFIHPLVKGFFFSALRYLAPYNPQSEMDTALSPGGEYRMFRDIISLSLSYAIESGRVAALTEKLAGDVGSLAAEAKERIARRISELPEEERAELEKVRHILDENRLSYHFQPIVRAQDGEIYAFEALMRDNSGAEISPYYILKYAELAERLGDVEKATFLNILRETAAHRDALKDRYIFINSIPGARLLPDDYVAIENALWAQADHVVVEITEQTEADEQKLKILKHRYEQMGIDIALDDYGTGYSNVINLLQYMPKYVKIDRTLICGIENDLTRQRFVREIIDFCRDNEILALAEGVETSQELKVMIRMGVDLIQGYYTARPSAELIDTISPKIKNEIATCYWERLSGNENRVFTIGLDGRVSLNNIERSGYSCIVVEKSEASPEGLVISGEQGFKNRMRAAVARGCKGKIILENVWFSGSENFPCIDIGEYSDIVLHLSGHNHLEKGGIRVPDSSRLRIEGEGSLDIFLEGQECYGIGNTLKSAHGMISLGPEGMIEIRMNGESGVCIGSGTGGEIFVDRGRYDLDVNGETGVAIGALRGKTKLTLTECDITAKVSVVNGVSFGTMEGDADLEIKSSSVHSIQECREGAGFGTIHGGIARFNLSEAGVDCDLRGKNVTQIGALYGNTEFRQQRANLKATINGKNSLMFGGYEGETHVMIEDSDTMVEINTAMKTDSLAPPGNIRIRHGKNYPHFIDYE